MSAGAEALLDPQPVSPNAHLRGDRGLAIAAHRLERHDLLLAGLGVHARVEQELHGREQGRFSGFVAPVHHGDPGIRQVEVDVRHSREVVQGQAVDGQADPGVVLL